MAYRRLLSVTFALLGVVSSACGGDVGSTANASVPGDQVPASADPAPGSADSVPPSSDRAPSSTEQPPSSADAPAGNGGVGGLVALCRQVCSSVDQLADSCSGGMASMGVGKLCDTNCQVPDQAVPCVNELSDLFHCVFDNIGQLCMAATAGDAPAAGNSDLCKSTIDDVSKCTKDAGGDATMMGDGGMKMPPGDAGSCTDAGGCKNCGDDCLTCACKAGTDVQKLADCASSSACM